MAKESLDLIDAMFDIAKATRPITGRGVGYKLFTCDRIPSMATKEMQRVYRLLKQAREQKIIPWHWIVDEGREDEGVPSWDNPADFARSITGQYRRDFWNQQPARVVLWSEKGTVRGLLGPVLDAFGVRFKVLHGFSSATVVHDIAEDDDGRPLIILYVGDWDPSGLYMSECDLPERLKKYDGHHVQIIRVALVQRQLASLPSLPAGSPAPRKYCLRCYIAFNQASSRVITARPIRSTLRTASAARPCSPPRTVPMQSAQSTLGFGRMP